MHKWLVTSRAVLLACLCVGTLAGCGAARVRAGAIGTGIALPVEGPGVQAAVSDASGAPLAGVDAHINLPGVLRVAYAYVRGLLPDITAVVAGAGAVPTSPLPDPAPAASPELPAPPSD